MREPPFEGLARRAPRTRPRGSLIHLLHWPSGTAAAPPPLARQWCSRRTLINAKRGWHTCSFCSLMITAANDLDPRPLNARAVFLPAGCHLHRLLCRPAFFLPAPCMARPPLPAPDGPLAGRL